MPIRETLARLEWEKFVKIITWAGTMVAPAERNAVKDAIQYHPDKLKGLFWQLSP